MKRIVLLSVVAVIMVVMIVATAGGPALAVSGFAKGQGPGSVSTNPGEEVSDPKGDTNINVVNPQCDPSNFERSKSPNGQGCNNN